MSMLDSTLKFSSSCAVTLIRSKAMSEQSEVSEHIQLSQAQGKSEGKGAVENVFYPVAFTV